MKVKYHEKNAPLSIIKSINLSLKTLSQFAVVKQVEKPKGTLFNFIKSIARIISFQEPFPLLPSVASPNPSTLIVGTILPNLHKSSQNC